MNIWVVSTLGLLWIVLLWTFVYRFLHGPMFSLLLDIYPEVEYQDNIVKSMLTHLRSCQADFQSGCIICILTSSVWQSQFLHILTNTGYCLHFIITIPVGVNWYLIVVSFAFSWMAWMYSWSKLGCKLINSESCALTSAVAIITQIVLSR